MTNEEKAIEVYRTRYLKGEEREIMRERRIGFVAGANWKEQQFKEFLEKKRNELQEISSKDFYDTSYAFGGVKYLDEIITELFPKIEEQDNTDRDE